MPVSATGGPCDPVWRIDRLAASIAARRPPRSPPPLPSALLVACKKPLELAHQTHEPFPLPLFQLPVLV